MISIPVAVHHEHFRWQLDLFWYAHKKVYGEAAKEKSYAIILERNFSKEEKQESLLWDIDIPHKMCKPYFEIHKDLVSSIGETILRTPLNIQVGLNQILDNFPDEEVLELLDCDLIHFRPYDKVNPKDNELFVCDIYEDWHLRSLTDNKFVIEPYFKNEGKYYNGGFVPLIARAGTFKKIIKDWTDIHKDILIKRDPDPQITWWAGMFALSAACENNKIQMIHKDTCYVPTINKINENHYIGHYSVDMYVKKKKGGEDLTLFPNKKYYFIDYSLFPDNEYYNMIKEWYLQFIQKERNYKLLF
jgi:hypothetical protein